jgi:hypothetical protein
VRSHFKHSIELVDREGDIVDVLAAVEDFLLAQATYEAARQRSRLRDNDRGCETTIEAARQRWPKERFG